LDQRKKPLLAILFISDKLLCLWRWF